MFVPLHLGTFTDTITPYRHEHPSILVQLHRCPSLLTEEALCSCLRSLPRALQLPKLVCAKHNWLVRSSLNFYIDLYVPGMFKSVFIICTCLGGHCMCIHSRVIN